MRELDRKDLYCCSPAGRETGTAYGTYVNTAKRGRRRVRYRTKWHFEITDPGKVERRFLVPSESLIRAEVNAKKEAAVGTIPGVRVWSTEETDY